MADVNALLSLTRGELRALGAALRGVMSAGAAADPGDAYNMIALFKSWDKDENIDKAGVVREFNGVLYVSKSAIQANGDPNRNPFATRGVLWEAIPNPNEDGSREHPISYHLGMQLTVGLYYTDADVVEDDALYYCKRTEQDYAFQHHLADLVSSGYVEVVTA